MTRKPSAERRRQLTEAALRAMTRDGVPQGDDPVHRGRGGRVSERLPHCFDSKQALIEPVITTVMDHFVDVVREAIQPQSTLQETIRVGFRAYGDHAAARPGEHTLTYELTQYALREPEFTHPARRQYGLYTDTCAEPLERLRGTMGFELGVPVPVSAGCPAAVTDGLTLDFPALGDEKTCVDIIDTVTGHVAALVGEQSVREFPAPSTGLPSAAVRRTP
jgi:AcrR family transcriptional regulator